MPRQRHYYGLNHLHFITASTYRRVHLFDSDRFRRQFISTLDALRIAGGDDIVIHVVAPTATDLSRIQTATDVFEWAGTRRNEIVGENIIEGLASAARPKLAIRIERAYHAPNLTVIPAFLRVTGFATLR